MRRRERTELAPRNAFREGAVNGLIAGVGWTLIIEILIWGIYRCSQ